MKKLNPIITSLLETDAYKINMACGIFHQFNSYKTRWAFKCRNADVMFTKDMVDEIIEQVNHYCSLRFTEDELDYIRDNFSWISSDFVDFLRFWHPRSEEISIKYTGQKYNNGIEIEANGAWLNTTFYEIAILAIVNEVYFSFTYGEGSKDIDYQKTTMAKFDRLLNDEITIGKFSEFGLRRRYSKAMQDWLIKYLVSQNIPGFVGTSNVYLAKKYNIKPIGTQAHEWYLCIGQGNMLYNPAYSNKLGMDAWRKEFGRKLGIVLNDTLGDEVFLRDFNEDFAWQFDGLRHDSGDPLVWGDKMLAHYDKLKIDPKTKTLLFSDSLDFDRAAKIYDYFKDRTNVAFGIGTYLTNDLGDSSISPLNIVMKPVECNGYPVAKLSNNIGKTMCQDDSYINYLTRCINWRLEHDKN